MQQPDLSSPQRSLGGLAKALGRLLCWWWLAELLVHLMYMHALYSRAPLLERLSCWALGNRGNVGATGCAGRREHRAGSQGCPLLGWDSLSQATQQAHSRESRTAAALSPVRPVLPSSENITAE